MQNGKSLGLWQRISSRTGVDSDIVIGGELLGGVTITWKRQKYWVYRASLLASCTPLDDIERFSDLLEAESEVRVRFDGDGDVGNEADVDGTSNVGNSANSSMIPRDTLNVVWHEGLWR